MRILVVEDEKTLCETIAKGLRLDGYEVDTCFSGDVAWDMALSESYDLIILDLNLPGMDGMDVLRNIRREDAETAILILSKGCAVSVRGLPVGSQHTCINA